jgi:hypothetical protein
MFQKHKAAQGVKAVIVDEGQQPLISQELKLLANFCGNIFVFGPKGLQHAKALLGKLLQGEAARPVGVTKIDNLCQNLLAPSGHNGLLLF